MGTIHPISRESVFLTGRQISRSLSRICFLLYSHYKKLRLTPSDKLCLGRPSQIKWQISHKVRWGTAEERKDASINECQLLLWKLQRDGATVLHSVQDSQIFLSYLWFSVKFLIQIGRYTTHICPESNLGHFEIPEDLNTFLGSS